jgi:hypothetical protein
MRFMEAGCVRRAAGWSASASAATWILGSVTVLLVYALILCAGASCATRWRRRASLLRFARRLCQSVAVRVSATPAAGVAAVILLTSAEAQIGRHGPRPGRRRDRLCRAGAARDRCDRVRGEPAGRSRSAHADWRVDIAGEPAPPRRASAVWQGHGGSLVWMMGLLFIGGVAATLNPGPAAYLGAFVQHYPAAVGAVILLAITGSLAYLTGIPIWLTGLERRLVAPLPLPDQRARQPAALGAPR